MFDMFSSNSPINLKLNKIIFTKNSAKASYKLHLKKAHNIANKLANKFISETTATKD